jgi:hypothetical protein
MTRAQLERWLVGHDRSHLEKCHWSVVVDGTNDDLNDAIWDGLRAVGVAVSNPSAVTSGQVQEVQDRRLNGFLLATRFRLLERVLAHYKSVASQAIGINNRMDFSKRAEGLSDDLYGRDRKGGLKAEVDQELTWGGGGVLVGERLPYTNIPDSPCIVRVP